MAAGSVSVLSPFLVSVVFRCYKVVQQVTLHSFIHSFFRSFLLFPHIIPSCPSYVALLYRLNVWQLTVNVSAALHCMYPCLHFGLRSTAEGMHGGAGSPPVIHLNFPSVFEMASQRPCMINVTTLTHTVLPRVPAEYLKTRNFSKSPQAGLGMFDWQSAYYSTFPIVPVMSCTQVNKPTN